MERAAPDEGYCMICGEHSLKSEIAIMDGGELWICRPYGSASGG